MTDAQGFLDLLLLVILPYVAFVVFFLGTIERYRTQTFSYSSLSSQFLENQNHFWAMVPFHFGVLAVVAGHVVGFLIPREVLIWNSRPLRLYVLEVSALIFGLLTIVGLAAMIHRRVTDAKLRPVTTAADWVVYTLLVIQVLSGVLVAVFYPWGSSWYAAAAAPYLTSLLTLNPDASYIAAMPHLVKLHIINAYVLIAFFPFSRLVHILVVPNPYLWRKPQVVRWYRRAW